MNQLVGTGVSVEACYKEFVFWLRRECSGKPIAKTLDQRQEVPHDTNPPNMSVVVTSNVPGTSMSP
jgi:hypothetical protein